VIAEKYIKEKHPQESVLKHVGLPRSSYHYKQSFSKRGRKPSEVTMKRDGTFVSNSAVVKDIKDLFDEEEFACYGYTPVTHKLKPVYDINRKKVYRLMKKENLLLKRISRTALGKQYVQFRKIKGATLFSNLQMDIKYVYIQGERRNVYLLNIIDVCSRVIIGHLLSPTMKALRVVGLLSYVFRAFNIDPARIDVLIRTDNGCQFVADALRKYLASIDAKHEFTHVATPEENAYVESFHSIIERELFQRFEFESLSQAKEKIDEYMEWYNMRRIHASLGYKTPMAVLNEAFSKIKVQNGSNLS
jgi:transposase InsO family protein